MPFTMKNTYGWKDIQLWQQSTQERARQLLSSTNQIAEDVMSSLDNLTVFLDLTARLSSFDADNLLLIWTQHPSSSCLAGWNTWRRLFPPDARILKKEFIKKPINLVLPFTTKTKLTWYSNHFYDVSQTNMATAPPVFDKTYIQDSAHEDLLLGAIKLVLSTKFHRSVLLLSATSQQKDLGLSGEITSNAVTVRSDLEKKEMLLWLADALTDLSIREAELSPSSMIFMKTCVSYCLFRIWGLEQFAPAPISSVQMRTVESKLSFLHLLRDTVYDINNLVSSAYQQGRAEDAAQEEREIEAILP